LPNELHTRERLNQPRDVRSVWRESAADDVARPQYPPPAAEGGLSELGKVFWERKAAIVAFAAAGAALGLLAAWVQPALYQAKALLEMQDLNENFLNMREVTATAGPDSPARADLQTHVQILGSRSVIEAAASQFVGRQDEMAQPATTSAGWLPFPWRRSTAAEAERGEAVQTASESLRVRSTDASRVIEIVCDSTDPRIAAGFANAVVDEFVARTLQSRWDSAQQTERWLSRQLAAARGKLEGAESSLREYVQQRGLFFTPEQLGIEEDKLRQFQQALSRAQEERAVRQSRHELAGSRAAQQIPEVLDDGALRGYQTKLVDLRRQYAELASLYTDQHHRVKQVLAQIRTLEPVVEQERANTISRIHNEFDAALRRERLLAESYSRQKELVLRQADVAVEYNLLDREVQTARQIYETLLQRVKEAGIAGAMTASPARIVDRASEPPSPYKPNRALSAAMGLLTGIFLGAVFVFLRDQADHRLKRPGDAALHLGVAELGVVYKSARLAGAGLYSGSALVLRIAWRDNRAPAKIVPADSRAGAAARIEMASWQRRNSRWAECFRAARTSILFHEGRTRLKSLVVTSPCPGEGKSTIACNLAIAMAETGRRTLLVDADLRKPRLHEVFGVSGGRGLSDLLEPVEPLARLPLHSYLRDTAIPALSLLPSGALNRQGLALLHAERTAELLQRLEREFDIVVLDTPPLLPVSDARILARFAGAAVLVLRLNESTREQARLAVEPILADGSRVLGVVLNAWKPRAGAAGYYAGRYEYAGVDEAHSPEKTLAASA
jgi:capsular exopolysaccharide synthesis family protein